MYCESRQAISLAVVLVVGPNLLHLSSQGEPGLVYRPCTTENGLLSRNVARTIASICGLRGPQSLNPAMMLGNGQEQSDSSFSVCDRQARGVGVSSADRRSRSHELAAWEKKRKQKTRLWEEESFFFSVPAAVLRHNLVGSSSGEIPLEKETLGRHPAPAACSVNCLLLGSHIPVESSRPLTVLLTRRLELIVQRLVMGHSRASGWLGRAGSARDPGSAVQSGSFEEVTSVMKMGR